MEALAAPLSARGVRPRPRRRARSSRSLPTRASLRGRLGTPARGGVVDAGAFIAPRRCPAREAGPSAPPGSGAPLGVNDDGDDPAPAPAPRPREGPVPNPPAQARGGPRRALGAGVVARLRRQLVGRARRVPTVRCQTALSSSYSVLFGVPQSAYGALAYGLVAALAWWGANERRAPSTTTRMTRADAGDAGARAKLVNQFARIRALFALSAAGLAGVSSYLLYVLAVPLRRRRSVYCLTSAAISFSPSDVGAPV